MNYSDLDLTYDSVHIMYVDNNNIFIASLNDEYIQSLKKYFSNMVKHARFSASYKSGNWDGYIRFFQHNGLLPKGLLPECIDILNKWNYKYHLDEKLKIETINISNFETIIKKELIDKQKQTLNPWEHQWETAKQLILAKRGITKSATSSGKSYTMTMVIKYLLYNHYIENVLLVVPRSDLVLQFQQDAIDYGFNVDDIGLYFGRVKDENKSFLISTWQSLQNIKEREFFEKVDCLVIDECHGAKTNDKSSKKKRKNRGTKMRQICDLCTNASWRFGFTGTMPTDPLEQRTIISGIGPIINVVKASELMKKGHISQLKIIIPFISYNKKIVKEKINENLLEMGITKQTKKEDIPITAKFNAEKKFLEEYIPRYKLISKIIKVRLKKNENILILANTLNFGSKLEKVLKYLLKNQVNKIYYISGEMNEYDRKQIRQYMETHTKVIIIATTSLFSTGISIKNLHSVIFSSIGKSMTRTIQSVGRSLRKHSSKDMARIYDLVDDIKYSRQHAQERINFYIEEEYDHEIVETVI